MMELVNILAKIVFKEAFLGVDWGRGLLLEIQVTFNVFTKCSAFFNNL